MRGQIKRRAGLLIQNLYTTLNKPGCFTQTPGFCLSPVIVLAGIADVKGRKKERGTRKLQSSAHVSAIKNLLTVWAVTTLVWLI